LKRFQDDAMLPVEDVIVRIEAQRREPLDGLHVEALAVLVASPPGQVRPSCEGDRLPLLFASSLGSFASSALSLLLDAQSAASLPKGGSEPFRSDGVSEADGQLQRAAGKLPNTTQQGAARRSPFNNSAWTLAWRGGYQNSEALRAASSGSPEALRLYPDDYVFNRNMAIVLKRFKEPPSARRPSWRSAARGRKEKKWAEI